MTPTQEVANWEIFLWALHTLGASAEFVDIEQVALECFRIAPARFAWRTRADLPDYKKCAKALRDAEARRPRLLVKTGDSFARQLSAEGQQWVEENAPRLCQSLGGSRPVPEPRGRPTARMLAEIEGAEAFAQWRAAGAVPLEKWRMADVLRCSPDSPPATWQERLEHARAVARAAGSDEVLRFLDAVGRGRPEWFGG